MGAQEGDQIKSEEVNGVALAENQNGDANDSVSSNNNNNNEKDSNGANGNEDKKIFCGGISYETTNEDLSNYFNKFGDVVQAQVKFDRLTGRSRGFAFVEFATVDACQLALAQREQLIKNKQCEIKPAKTREPTFSNKKVFVGGLPADFPEEDLRSHFDEFGKVEEIEWPFDKQTKARRNFAFIVFEEEEAADRAANTAKQTFGSRECDVKKAVPQNKRNKIMHGANMLRGAFAGSLRGPAMGVPNAAQWYGGWPHVAGLPYTTAAAANATAAGTWGDWYGNAANYYQQAAAQNGTNGAGNYNAYNGGVTNGYGGSHDYGQAGSLPMNRQAQNGTVGTGQRYH
jgi:RNA recognition motif-containing protein